MKRPNILMIFSDQHRYDCMGVSGHPLARTPNMDRLAREGIDFRRAYTPCAVCSPARQTLVTGRWPHNHGGICLYNLSESRACVGPEETFFPQLLAEAGYRTGFMGKWHVSSKVSPADAGYGEVVDMRELQQALAKVGSDQREQTRVGAAPGRPKRLECDTELFQPVWLANQANAMMKRFVEAGEEPFFVSLHFHEPHPPYALAEPYASLYDPEAIEPWPNFRDAFEEKPYIQRQMLEHWDLANKDWEYWKHQVAGYLGAVSAVDDCIGRTLDQLETLGIADDTLVVYSSDHGDMIGSHGMYDKHNCAYEEILRVPLLCRWPNGIEAGQACDGFVSNCLDLPSAFLELAGVEIPSTFEGKSLAGLWRGEEQEGRDVAFSAYYGGQFGLNTIRSATTERWKYVFNAMGPDELYDLREDPGELKNRIRDESLADVLKELRRRVVEQGLATSDGLFRNPWMPRSFEEGRIL